MGGITKAIGRIFTPPGTGGVEAAQQQAAAAKVTPLPQAPATPDAPKAPPAAAAFSPSATAQKRQAGAITASSILGAAATAGSTRKATLG